jgi:hypothetical protein
VDAVIGLVVVGPALGMADDDVGSAEMLPVKAPFGLACRFWPPMAIGEP